MLEVTDATIHEALKTGKFLLMFYTGWCQRCPPIIEILTELEQAEAGKFQFARINFDDNPLSRDLFQIPGVPVILVIKDRLVIEGWGGLTERYAYRKIINETLNGIFDWQEG